MATTTLRSRGGPTEDTSRSGRSHSQNSGDRHAVAPPPQQPQLRPVWTAIGHVASSAWSALKLAHRYVLTPATVWVLRNLKAYVEEQLAIQKALMRPCAVPKYTDAEVRQATDDLSFTRRAFSTPYGLMVYPTRLRGSPVVVRQVNLNRMQDAETFWEEAAAGRALLAAAGRHSHVVPYAGCCPSLACHVYEQRNGTCSLREALLSSSPYCGALSSWEARLAVCHQLVSAVVHLTQLGISAGELSASHVLVWLGPGSGDPEVDVGRSGNGGSGHSERGLQCWLAPGCELRAVAVPPVPEQPAPGRCGARASPCGRGSAAPAGPAAAAEPAVAADRFVVMGRGVGQLLMQVLGGTDTAGPLPATVLQALADMAPTRVLAPSVAPPLTDDQAWPLLAAVYSLLVWGRKPAGPEWPGPAAARRNTAGPAAPTTDSAKSLQSHLQREVAPALAELQQQLRQAAAAMPSRAVPGHTPGPGMPPSPSQGAAEDAFAGASAPPLPVLHSPAHSSVPSGPIPTPPQGPATVCAAACAAAEQPAARPSRGGSVATASAPPPPSSPVRQGPPEELLCYDGTDDGPGGGGRRAQLRA